MHWCCKENPLEGNTHGGAPKILWSNFLIQSDSNQHLPRLTYSVWLYCCVMMSRFRYTHVTQYIRVAYSMAGVWPGFAADLVGVECHTFWDQPFLSYLI